MVILNLYKVRLENKQVLVYIVEIMQSFMELAQDSYI